MILNKKTPLILAIVVIAAVVIGTLVVRNSGGMGLDDAAGATGPETAASPSPEPDSPNHRGTGVAARGGSADVETRLQQTVASRQEARQESIKRSAELKMKAAETFKNERVDPKWAPQKEVELNTIAAQPAFETAGVVPKDLRVDCKSSMCRLDGSFASNGDAEDWILLYMSSVGSTLPNSIVSRNQNPDGTTSVEIYGRAR